MGIKQYVFLSIIFIFLVGLFVYAIDGTMYTLTFLSREFTFPVAVWITIPLILLFLASVFHLVYYGVKIYFEKRVIKKDYETFLFNIKDCVINEENVREYKTDFFKNLSKIIKKLDFNQKSDNENIEPTFLNEVFESLHEIYNGKYVDIKKLKLRNDNPITIQNRLNMLNYDGKTFLDAFKNHKTADDDFTQKAYKKFAETSSFADVKKQNFKLTNEIAMIIFDRYANEKDYSLSNEDIKNILEKIDFTCKEYLNIAKILKTKIDPSSLLSIFEDIQSKNSTATTAYLYILFELQMIDKARDFLDNTEENEYQKFKILLFLRDSGKNIDTDLII